MKAYPTQLVSNWRHNRDGSKVTFRLINTGRYIMNSEAAIFTYRYEDLYGGSVAYYSCDLPENPTYKLFPA